MSQPPDPDFLSWSPAAAPAAPPSVSQNVFEGLTRALEEYRCALTGVQAGGSDRCAEALSLLRQSDRAVRDCLRALGWRPATGDPEPPIDRPESAASQAAGDAGGQWQPGPAAAALVEQLAAADRDSRVLCERIQASDDPGRAGIVRAARRCHFLIADALLLGAVELAARLGIPDTELPG